MTPTEPLHEPDAVSDPAKDDTEGQDWSSEGGATRSGPATDVDADHVERGGTAPSAGE